MGGVYIGVLSFFFKEETAYEVLISDWNSDVCSSDLVVGIDRAVLGRQIANMAIRGQHLEIATEIFLDRFRLCGRFHNYQLHEKPLVLTVPYVRTREGGVVRVIVNRKFLVTSKRAVRYSRDRKSTRLNSSH